MLMPDVNILMYAHREEEKCHESYAKWLVAHAQHAALAISGGCTWVTRDRDFSKFEPHGLRWQHLVLG